MSGVAAGCLAMIVTITTSGGFGGLGLVKSTRVEVETLPEALQAETCARLDADALQALEARGAARGEADLVMYHITVHESSIEGAFDLPEAVLPGETLDLIDQLLALGKGK